MYRLQYSWGTKGREEKNKCIWILQANLLQILPFKGLMDSEINQLYFYLIDGNIVLQCSYGFEGYIDRLISDQE